MTLALAGAVSALPAAAIPEGLRMVGLAVHQETGRDIYLGAIHVDAALAGTQDLTRSTGGKTMEYRVIARRTSIRSLLGSILLQAELATGRAADSNTTRFVEDIMAGIRGSLYAGDAFELSLLASGASVAALNGHELARSADSGVFDYFLHGWLGDKGASSQFRSSLLAPDIDTALLDTYRSHQTPVERITAVGEWIAPPEQVPAPTTVAADPESGIAEQLQADVVVASLATQKPTVANLASAEPAPREQLPVAAREPVLPAPGNNSQDTLLPQATAATQSPAGQGALELVEPTLQLALVTPQRTPLVANGRPASALDLADYSARLAEFNTSVLRMVTNQIRYPRAAVRRNLQGSLELDLQLTPEGALETAAVARSSGHRILDEAALRAARDAFEESSLDDIDSVAIAEYRAEDGSLLVPVPVNFILMQ